MVSSLALDAPACVLGRVEDLERKLLGHALPAPLPCKTHDPAAGKPQAPPPPHPDGDLGRGPAPAARHDLERRGGRAQRRLEDLARLPLVLLSRARKPGVDTPP